MLIPLEIAVLLLGASAAMLWTAVRLEQSGLARVGFALTAVGCLTMAVSGRAPPLPGMVGYSTFVGVGVWMVIAGIALAAIGELATWARERWRRRRPPVGTV
jgi:hypothetical protein